MSKTPRDSCPRSWTSWPRPSRCTRPNVGDLCTSSWYIYLLISNFNVCISLISGKGFYTKNVKDANMLVLSEDARLVLCDGVSVWCDDVSVWCDDVTVWCDDVTVWCDDVTVWCVDVSVWCDGVSVRCDGVSCGSGYYSCQCTHSHASSFQWPDIFGFKMLL